MKFAGVVFAILCLLPAWSTARAQGSCAPGTATQILDGNDVAASLYNNGSFFWSGAGNMYRVPKDGRANSIFNTSLWIGGIAGGELRMAGSQYGPFEFWPGPIPADGSAPRDCSAYDRMYKVTRSDLIAYEATGNAAPDLADWPWRLGAPVLDGDGDPDNYDLMAGDRPALVGDQIIWWIMNDAAGEHAESQTAPVSMEVRVTATAISRETSASLIGSTFTFIEALHTTTFYRFQVRYRGPTPLEDAYVGFYADVDLGDASDDFVGSDTTLGLAFAYNGDDFDSGSDGYGERPPAVGFDFVKGLRAASDGIDNDGDGVVDENGERLQMTGFMVPIKGPTVQGICCHGMEYYRALRSLWRDGTSVTFGGDGYGGDESTSFMYPGMPPAYWSMEDADGAGMRHFPSDKKFVFSMGPVTMQPGDEQDFTLAIVWARGDDRLASVRKLKAADAMIQMAVDMDLLAPDPRWLDVSDKIPSEIGRRHHRSGLGQNHPNPATGSTAIPYEVADQTHVEITVHDLLGREVARLVDGVKTEGRHEVVFDTSGLPAGVYYYRMSAFFGTVARAMVVVD